MFTLIAPTYMALHVFRQLLITLNLYLYLLYISRSCTHVSPTILFIYVARQFASITPTSQHFIPLTFKVHCAFTDGTRQSQWDPPGAPMTSYGRLQE